MNLFSNTALKKRALKKTAIAIAEGDLSLLKKQLGKIQSEQLNSPLFEHQGGYISAAELAIVNQQAKALEHLLQSGCSTEYRSSDQPLLYLALQQKQSLALLTVLLQQNSPTRFAGLEISSAEFACFRYCPAASLMLHLSRLVEYGGELNQVNQEGHSLLLLALATEQQSLLQFMINSGAEIPHEIADNWCSNEIVSYAKRCADDLRIRQMMLG
ncbi:hypothetical protein [Amphritea sp. HPY]|uniref:hypothetical protein n=1 Tax=Amphritea sp. HPY TaxID=3421652 RepID=UPI003D7EA8A4